MKPQNVNYTYYHKPNFSALDPKKQVAFIQKRQKQNNKSLREIPKEHKPELSRSYLVLVGTHGWYRVQFFCPGFKVCPLEW